MWGFNRNIFYLLANLVRVFFSIFCYKKFVSYPNLTNILVVKQCWTCIWCCYCWSGTQPGPVQPVFLNRQFAENILFGQEKIIWWESKALNARAAWWYFCIPLQMQSQSVCYCYLWRHSLLELRWNILEVPSYELHICAITTHSMRSDWPKIWHKNYYDFNLLQNRHFTTDFL